MHTRVLPMLSFFILFGAACSDATDDSSGPPATAGSSTAAGSAGQATAAGTAGLSGTSGGTGSATAGAAGAAPAAGGTAGSPGAGTAGSSLGGTGGGGGTPGGGGSGAAGASAGGAAGGGGTAALDGKGLYDANCKACHGEQGVGGPLAYEIVHPVRDYSTWVVRNGRAQTTFPQPMDKWDTTKLSDAQLMLIFDYLDKPPQPTTGKALYDDYCASCHGADAKGGPTMRPLTNEVGKVLTQVRSGKNVGKFAMRRDYMPAFPSSDISDAELMLIRDYVDSL